VVSIAESFNYRIFERKRRLEESTSGPTPSMPCLSVEQKPKNHKADSSAWGARNNTTCFLARRRSGSLCTRLSGSDMEHSKNSARLFLILLNKRTKEDLARKSSTLEYKTKNEQKQPFLGAFLTNFTLRAIRVQQHLLGSQT
jgi:hypothetical protein